jgi:stress-induced morphogen
MHTAIQVNDALKEELAEHIHALSIKKTKTPAQEAASTSS